MGEEVVVSDTDINELDANIGEACAHYVASYADLSRLMLTFQNGSGSIGGPLANELYQLFASKEDIFNSIKKDLLNAQSYMGDKGKGLMHTMNNISGGMR